LGNFRLVRINKAKGGFRIDTVAGHQPVTPLENVQRQHLSRKENDAEREKRDA
jgi:hypothetical protein